MKKLYQFDEDCRSFCVSKLIFDPSEWYDSKLVGEIKLSLDSSGIGRLKSILYAVRERAKKQ